MIHVAAPDVSANTPLLTSDRALLTPLADGTGVLLHLDTKFYYTLNATGVFVWRTLAAATTGGGATRAALVDALVAAFEVAAEVAAADVDTMLNELIDEALVVRA